MRLLLLLLSAALLVGCGAAESPRPRLTRKERQDAAEAKLARTPVPRSYRYADGELRVLQVPVADEYGIVVEQPCFIWRDTELKTASIHCAGESLPPAPPQPPRAEDDRPRY